MKDNLAHESPSTRERMLDAAEALMRERGLAWPVRLKREIRAKLGRMPCLLHLAFGLSSRPQGAAVQISDVINLQHFSAAA